MRWEYHVAYLSHPTASRCKIGTKYSFGAKSKAPFITDRFQYNLNWLVACAQRVPFGTSQSHHSKARGHTDEKLSSSSVKSPLIPTDFNVTCTALYACTGSSMWHISVTPLQCDGRYIWKSPSALVWSSLHYWLMSAYLALLIGQAQGVQHGVFQFPHCNAIGNMDEKLFRPQE
jgi:hypothetical protein